jgi:hypothetical protein
LNGGFGFSFDSSCVQCIVEPCLLPNATVANPCPGQPPITGCEVAVNRVSAVGCIQGCLSNLFVPRCGGGTAFAFNQETFCVNNVICFTCCETSCPNFCTGIGTMFTSFRFSVGPCGNTQGTLTGFFVLPTCV